MELDSETCSWCGHRAAERTWQEMRLCPGCWIDLTVDEYLRAWSTDPQVGRALTYRGIPLAATLEYDLLQELIAVFGRLIGRGPSLPHPTSPYKGEVAGEPDRSEINRVR